MSWSTITGTRLDTLLREIDIAMVERGLHALKISTGTNIQSAALIAGMQNAIKQGIEYTGRIADCARLRWVNHQDGPLNAAQNDFLYWDIDSFTTETGLNNPDLWRRKASMEDDFSYGVMQAGDIIGSWIIEDLQSALNAMKLCRYYTFIGERVGNLSKSGTAATWGGNDWKFGSYYDVSATSNQATGALHRGTLSISFVTQEQVDADYIPRLFGSSGNCYAYIKGDAEGKDSFSSHGDLGIVQGTDADIVRVGKITSYPSGLINFPDCGSYFSTNLYAFHSNVSAPGASGSGVSGYEVPLKTDGDEAILTVRYLIEPNFTYG
jgi:hypothetical protein